jgi:cell division protease FtsH
MALDAWLPMNYAIPRDTTLKAVVSEGVNWQIYSTHSGGRALLAKEELANRWLKSGLIEDGAAEYFQFGKEKFYSLTSSGKHHLAPVSDCPTPKNKNEALAFAEALGTTRTMDKETSLGEAIYAEKITRLLPTYCDPAPVSDDIILGTWLTGGVPISANANERLKKLVGWLDNDSLDDIRDRAAITKTKDKAKGSQKSAGGKGKYTLAGRPYLENFINEHIVDIIQNQERYKALGIDFPSAIILHGPPGCGKTYAIERLVEYLGWPCYNVEASSVASPYIHETSKKIAAVFDKAMENSPAVIVIDEMEAFLADRQAGIGHHHVEEVAEFLRRIPEAIKNNVLIVAMTNRIEMIDPAILRRGRFDHVIKVDMASEEEVTALLEKLLNELPQEPGIDIPMLAKELVGRPLSDVAFIVREGGRLAARAGKDKVDHKCLAAALEASPARHKDNF